MTGVAALRLRAHRLVGEPYSSPEEAVRAYGAVQAQDWGAAKWALGQRTTSTEAAMDRLLDAGGILRVHVLRPTWHVVAAADVRWLLELTGPRVLAGLRSRHRQLGIDAMTIGRAADTFRAALAGGRHLTRAELGDRLRADGIEVDGARLTHLALTAELTGLVVSGPRRGAQITYALLAERAPQAGRLERGQALAELALRYFRAHGPAQLRDFVWWSGLTTAEARAGIAGAAAGLERMVVAGEDHWLGAGAATEERRVGVAHLLPNFDEYTVAYRDRSATMEEGATFDPGFFSFGSVISNVVTVDGRVRGRWRRRPGRGGVLVEVVLLDAARAGEEEAIRAAALRLQRFLERPVEVSIRA